MDVEVGEVERTSLWVNRNFFCAD